MLSSLTALAAKDIH